MRTKEQISIVFLENLRTEVRKKLVGKEKLNVSTIARKVRIKDGTVRKWFREKTIPETEALLKICDNLPTTPNDLLGFGDKKIGTTVEVPLILQGAIQTILNLVESPAMLLHEDEELVSFPILQLDGIQKNRTADRLILQNEICGRRKNVIPIRIDDKEKMNILLFTKRKGRETRIR